MAMAFANKSTRLDRSTFLNYDARLTRSQTLNLYCTRLYSIKVEGDDDLSLGNWIEVDSFWS